jgi:hypothetical protein
MTPRRWEYVGGWIGLAFGVVLMNLILNWPPIFSWGSLACVGGGLAMLYTGRGIVKEWYERG